MWPTQEDVMKMIKKGAAVFGVAAVLSLALAFGAGTMLHGCAAMEQAAEVAGAITDPERVDKAAVSGIATLEAVNNTVAMLVESGRVGPDDAESIVDRTDALYEDFAGLRESVNDPDAATRRDRLIAKLKTLLALVEKQYNITIYGTPEGE